MNDFDLTPEGIKNQYDEKTIAEAKTFKTHGVSELDADAYLNTSDGKLYFKRLREFDQNSSFDDLYDRAVGQIRSGTDLPRMEIMNEPLVQLVPAGGKPPSDSMPFWIKEADFQAASNAGYDLFLHFGLPIKSENYDVYRITPKAPTMVWVRQSKSPNGEAK